MKTGDLFLRRIMLNNFPRVVDDKREPLRALKFRLEPLKKVGHLNRDRRGSMKFRRGAVTLASCINTTYFTDDSLIIIIIIIIQNSTEK